MFFWNLEMKFPWNSQKLIWNYTYLSLSLSLSLSLFSFHVFTSLKRFIAWFSFLLKENWIPFTNRCIVATIFWYFLLKKSLSFHIFYYLFNHLVTLRYYNKSFLGYRYVFLSFRKDTTWFYVQVIFNNIWNLWAQIIWAVSLL